MSVKPGQLWKLSPWYLNPLEREEYILILRVYSKKSRRMRVRLSLNFLDPPIEEVYWEDVCDVIDSMANGMQHMCTVSVEYIEKLYDKVG